MITYLKNGDMACAKGMSPKQIYDIVNQVIAQNGVIIEINAGLLQQLAKTSMYIKTEEKNKTPAKVGDKGGN